MAQTIQDTFRRIIRDLRVELSDEWDKNFERQGFFTESWQRRKSPHRPGGATLVDTGALRRSIRVTASDWSITFSSDLPYSTIHNEGGTIRVTARMRRFFWAKYYETAERFDRKKDGTLSGNKRTRQLSSEADFWRAMALKKVGSSITIPRRQYLGSHPVVERIVTDIINAAIAETISYTITPR